MFVVNTIPQLEEAIRESAREVMIVGKLAPEMLKISDSSSASSHASSHSDFPTEFSFTHLFENFDILAVHDSGKNVIATVFQQRDGSKLNA